jgi:hypothetical protein
MVSVIDIVVDYFLSRAAFLFMSRMMADGDCGMTGFALSPLG